MAAILTESINSITSRLDLNLFNCLDSRKTDIEILGDIGTCSTIQVNEDAQVGTLIDGMSQLSYFVHSFLSMTSHILPSSLPVLTDTISSVCTGDISINFLGDGEAINRGQTFRQAEISQISWHRTQSPTAMSPTSALASTETTVLSSSDDFALIQLALNVAFGEEDFAALRAVLFMHTQGLLK